MYNLLSICCICLTDKGNLKSLNYNNVDDKEIFDKMNTCAFEEKWQESEFPIFICYNCHYLINVLHFFKEKCVSNNSILRRYISKCKRINKKQSKSFVSREIINKKYETVLEKFKSETKQFESISEFLVESLTDFYQNDKIDNTEDGYETEAPTSTISKKKKKSKSDATESEHNREICETNHTQTTSASTELENKINFNEAEILSVKEELANDANISNLNTNVSSSELETPIGLNNSTQILPIRVIPTVVNDFTTTRVGADDLNHQNNEINNSTSQNFHSNNLSQQNYPGNWSYGMQNQNFHIPSTSNFQYDFSVPQNYSNNYNNYDRQNKNSSNYYSNRHQNYSSRNEKNKSQNSSRNEKNKSQNSSRNKKNKSQDSPPLLCTKCNITEKFFDEIVFIKHHHNKHRKFYCMVCSKHFCAKTWNKHLEGHVSNKFSKKFINVNDVRNRRQQNNYKKIFL